MRELYPEIEPVESGFLPADTGHQVYYEECGARSGLPVAFLHGGPGSGAKPHHRQFFDPELYRIIVFDQRGTGRCQPYGRLQNNTTQALLADMDAIRERLGIPQWVVFGGSWGATLALLYAEQHPQRTAALVLRGTFLARSQDLHWMLGRGANRFFPEYWDEFITSLELIASAQGLSLSSDHPYLSPSPYRGRPDDVRNSRAESDGFSSRGKDRDRSEDGSLHPDALLEVMHAGLFGNDAEQQLAIAKAWSLWTGRVVTHTLGEDYKLEFEDQQKLIDAARIELHYAANHYFIRENQILQDISRVPEVPVKIIHGRRDMVCTPSASWSVHQALPKSDLAILPDAGHLASEPAMIDTLICTTDELAGQLS